MEGLSEQTNPITRRTRPLTAEQRAVLINIGFCLWFAVLFLSVGVLSAVHEAIRVRAGEGDSWRFAIMFVLANPIAVAVSLCCALRLWHEFKGLSNGE